MNTMLHTESTLTLTERLLLRRFQPADYDAYANYHSNVEVYRYLYSPVPDAIALRQQFEAAVKDRFADDGDTLRLAVTRREDGVILGEVLLKMAAKSALQGELGYIFNPNFSGHGYATEAAHAMLDFGFSRIGFHRIFARLDTMNAASVGVVKRLGMRREAHLLENDCFGGAWGSEYIYAILRSEWVSKSQP